MMDFGKSLKLGKGMSLFSAPLDFSADAADEEEEGRWE